MTRGGVGGGNKERNHGIKCHFCAGSRWKNPVCLLQGIRTNATLLYSTVRTYLPIECSFHQITTTIERERKKRERSGISRRIVCVCASPLTVRDEMNREVRAIAYSTSNSSANSSRVSSSKDEGKLSSSLSLFHMFSWMLLLVYILNNVRRRRPGERERERENR